MQRENSDTPSIIGFGSNSLSKQENQIDIFDPDVI